MTETITVSPPSIDSPLLTEVIAEIAEDARRRRENGGGRPDLALARVRSHRLGAVRVPVELGGAGYTKREFYELVIRLAEADPDVPHILRVHWGFTEDRLRLRNVENDRDWIGEITSGVVFGGATGELSTRPVGSSTFDTVLTPHDKGFRLNGRKFYSTGSLYADILRIVVNTADGGQAVAVIPADREGVVHVDDWDGIGQAETGSGTTILDEVEVAEHEVIPFESWEDGRKTRQSQPQLILHAVAAGILRSVVADATATLHSRRRTYSFAAATEPTADPQLLEVVGRLSSAAFVAEATVLAAADAQDRAADYAFSHETADDALELEASLLAAKTKVGIEDLALRAAGDLFTVGGASSTRASAHLDRHWRNLRTLFSHNPTPYKARAVGDYVVNGEPLPRVGFF
ncbi:acyl-CoA dehydrogenase [Gordonia rubripertincta]|uniref:acyl-CoA dehydrogenase n=1 Tax=Gordonia rubripertincta TaxID=36822 RepID=UPI000B8D6260|nr:acyl-CoA dehydrogenase [Gordonia rubripertincta]ASR01703.1 Dibenzothiophene desulfurization enzyme C [Gordonia rubripertincta]